MSARLPSLAACALAGILLLGGCATHAPVSETVLFHDDATLPTHETNRGFGGTGTVALTLAPALTTVRQGRPDRLRAREALINGRKAGGGFFVASYDERGRYALSATLGFPVVGVDATMRIWGRNYLTLSLSGVGQGQVFVQHRAFNSPQFGAAVGVGGRHEQYSFDGDHILDIEKTGVASVGLRLFGVLREKGDTGGGIKIGTYAGYTPRLNQPVLALTLTGGRF